MAPEFNDHDFDKALRAWRDSAHAEQDRPDWFWARQRSRIQSRMAKPDRRLSPRLALASLAATAAIAISLLVPGHVEHQQPKQSPVATNQDEMSDHDLMLQLQSTMQSDVPEALQPAGSLAQEMNQAFESNVSQGRSKEIRNEK